jgi:membrane-bound lytic murein transglycosylase MltF
MFRNVHGQTVGFDAEMAHQLARDLGVELELVRVDSGRKFDYLDDGRADIMMTGLTVTPERATKVRFSQPYMDATIAFVVRDHERNDFNSRKKIQALDRPRIAIMNIPYYVDTWITLKRRDGDIGIAYRHWILGKGAERKEPRWAVIRDVLGWVD